MGHKWGEKESRLARTGRRRAHVGGACLSCSMMLNQMADLF